MVKKSRFFRLCCAITGANPDWVDDIESKNKIVAMAMALFVPAIIWFVIGFALAYKIYGFSNIASLGVGAICASFIFLIDRIIILMSNTRPVNIVRILVGLLMSFIGATLVDTIVFEQDIDKVVVQKYQTQYADSTALHENASLKAQLQSQAQLVEQLRADLKAKQEAYQLEITGKLSGKSNPGPIAAAILERSKELETNLMTERQQLEVMQNQLQTADSLSKKRAVQEYDERSLLVRVKALHELVFSDVYIAIFYLLFLSLLLFLELIVIFLKIFSKKTQYDLDVEAYNKMKEKRRGGMFGPDDERKGKRRGGMFSDDEMTEEAA